jgi:hypothetical protein
MTLSRMHATNTPLVWLRSVIHSSEVLQPDAPPVCIRWEAVRLTDAANPFLSYDIFVTSERR